MSTRETLLAEIDLYLSLSGMTQTRFSVSATGDRSFVTNVRNGRQPRADMIDRVRDYMREHPPGGRFRSAA